MNKIQKPEWLLFAEKIRQQVDNMKPTKSGKRESERIYRAWLDATREHGYERNEYDWRFLIRRLGRIKNRPGSP